MVISVQCLKHTHRLIRLSWAPIVHMLQVNTLWADAMREHQQKSAFGCDLSSTFKRLLKWLYERQNQLGDCETT